MLSLEAAKQYVPPDLIELAKNSKALRRSRGFGRSRGRGRGRGTDVWGGANQQQPPHAPRGMGFVPGHSVAEQRSAQNVRGVTAMHPEKYMV